MSDDSQANNGLTIPLATKEQFGDLINLVVASESMNLEERQYWINILPIMTPDQLQNLQDILVNEKRQLAAIDAKYAKEIEQLEQHQTIKEQAHKRHDRRTNLLSAEQHDAVAEETLEKDILDQINSL